MLNTHKTCTPDENKNARSLDQWLKVGKKESEKYKKKSEKNKKKKKKRPKKLKYFVKRARNAFNCGRNERTKNLEKKCAYQ